MLARAALLLVAAVAAATAGAQEFCVEFEFYMNDPVPRTGLIMFTEDPNSGETVAVSGVCGAVVPPDFMERAQDLCQYLQGTYTLNPASFSIASTSPDPTDICTIDNAVIEVSFPDLDLNSFQTTPCTGYDEDTCHASLTPGFCISFQYPANGGTQYGSIMFDGNPTLGVVDVIDTCSTTEPAINSEDEHDRRISELCTNVMGTYSLENDNIVIDINNALGTCPFIPFLELAFPGAQNFVVYPYCTSTTVESNCVPTYDTREICGVAFLDANDDSLIDAGDYALSDVLVTLFVGEPQGVQRVFAQTRTGPAGGYTFENVPDHLNYRVEFHAADASIVGLEEDSTLALGGGVARQFANVDPDDSCLDNDIVAEIDEFAGTTETLLAELDLFAAPVESCGCFMSGGFRPKSLAFVRNEHKSEESSDTDYHAYGGNYHGGGEAEAEEEEEETYHNPLNLYRSVEADE